MKDHNELLCSTSFGNTEWTKLKSEVDDACPIIEKIDKKPKNEGIDGMKMPTRLPFFDPTSHLSDYLVFVREIQRQKFKSYYALSLVVVISNDDIVVANYSLNGFLNELLVLEDQYYSLHEKIEPQSYYYLFSSKLEKFVELGSSTSREQLKILTYLYTAAWRKYLTLKNRPSFLIIDIQIDEVNALINNDILPVIQDIKAEFNTSLKSLVEESAAMWDEINKEIEDYEGQLKKLNKQIAYRMIFGVIDVIATFTSCLGPYGAAAGNR